MLVFDSLGAFFTLTKMENLVMKFSTVRGLPTLRVDFILHL